MMMFEDAYTNVNIQWADLYLLLTTGQINLDVFCFLLMPVWTKTEKHFWYIHKKLKMKSTARTEDINLVLNNLVFISTSFPNQTQYSFSQQQRVAHKTFQLFLVQPSHCYRHDRSDRWLLSLSGPSKQKDLCFLTKCQLIPFLFIFFFPFAHMGCSFEHQTSLDFKDFIFQPLKRVLIT